MGRMSGLPEVLAVSGSALAQRSLLLRIAEACPAFSGHFPGVPLLPGVAQVDWALKLARLHLPAVAAQGGGFQSLAGLKFRRVIVPGTTLMLELSWSAPALSFHYRSEAGDQVFSQGRITLK